MNIFKYYVELLSKPKYMLSESETMFIDLFPYAIIIVICLVIYIIVMIIDKVRKGRK